MQLRVEGTAQQNATQSLEGNTGVPLRRPDGLTSGETWAVPPPSSLSASLHNQHRAMTLLIIRDRHVFQGLGELPRLAYVIQPDVF